MRFYVDGPSDPTYPSHTTLATILATALAGPAIAQTAIVTPRQGGGATVYQPGTPNPMTYATPTPDGGTRLYQPGASNPTTYCRPDGYGGTRCYTPGAGR